MNWGNTLGNYSFITLLGSMILYWIETSFAGIKNVGALASLPSLPADCEAQERRSNPFFPQKDLLSPLEESNKEWNTGAEQLIPSGLSENDEFLKRSLAGPNLKREELGKDNSFNSIYMALIGYLGNNKSLAKYGILISSILLGSLLLLRWKESGHFPLSNLYESLMFLSWCFTVLHLYIDSNTLLSSSPTSTLSSEEGGYFTGGKEGASFASKVFGAITTPSALLTNAFATFTLPKEMQEAAPLVPALQSNWLMMHVTVMILSYGALILGSLLSIAFLIVTIDSVNIKNNWIALTLDNLSYRILGIGFPLLTIGILSGAVWANEAWGSYWSWDPKETWALLTWLIFAIYLHTRLSKGWEGRKPAIIASFGFIIVWICYLGVNLLGEGLHSYGWLS